MAELSVRRENHERMMDRIQILIKAVRETSFVEKVKPTWKDLLLSLLKQPP